MKREQQTEIAPEVLEFMGTFENAWERLSVLSTASDSFNSAHAEANDAYARIPEEFRDSVKPLLHELNGGFPKRAFGSLIADRDNEPGSS